MNPIPREIEEVAREVVDAAFKVHTTLGPGLLENVYEACMEHELKKRGLSVARQVHLPVIYADVRLDAGLRLDLLVEESVVLELKAVEKLLPIHLAQALTYLKVTRNRLCLLVNFNVPIIKEGIRRVAL